MQPAAIREEIGFPTSILKLWLGSPESNKDPLTTAKTLGPSSVSLLPSAVCRLCPAAARRDTRSTIYRDDKVHHNVTSRVVEYGGTLRQYNTRTKFGFNHQIIIVHSDMSPSCLISLRSKYRSDRAAAMFMHVSKTSVLTPC